MMKNLKNLMIAGLVAAVGVAPACKAKKPIVTPPAAAAEPARPIPPPAIEKKPEPVKEETAAATPSAPDYNFKNIQFEFNSAVLKTSAYAILDKAAVELKKDRSAKFVLNGYASAEGTAEHNLSLSEERANAVKTYLVNAGVDVDKMTAKGFGEANPISQNTDEAGRALNRRVELKVKVK